MKNKNEFYETPFFNENGKKKNKSVFNPLFENEILPGIAEADPWAKRTPKQIMNDLTESTEFVRQHYEKPVEPARILILGHSDMPRKELVKKLTEHLNTYSLMDISFQECDKLLKDKNDLLCVKIPDTSLFNFTDTFLPDFHKAHEDSYLPTKKIRWKLIKQMISDINYRISQFLSNCLISYLNRRKNDKP